MKNVKNGKKTVKIAAAAFAAVMTVTTAAFCFASFDSNKIDAKVRTQTVAAAETDMGAVKNAAQVKAMNETYKGIDNTAKNDSAKKRSIARRGTGALKISKKTNPAANKLGEITAEAKEKLNEQINNVKHPGESGYCYYENEAAAADETANEYGKHPGESGYCYYDNEAADETVNEMGKHPGECGYGYVNEMGKHPGESGYCYNMNEASANDEVNSYGKHPGECGYGYTTALENGWCLEG